MCRFETEEDDEARQDLVGGFEVNEKFREYTVDDLSIIQAPRCFRWVA